MKRLNNYGVGSLLIGIAFLSGLVFSKLYAEQVSTILKADQSYSEVIIMVAGYEYHYQPRPDLGYVVVAKENNNAISSVYRDLSLSQQNVIKRIGGRVKQGFWIVESKQLSAQHNTFCQTLGVQNQVKYSAPLFCCNEEPIAVIPEIVVRVTPETEIGQLDLLCREVGCTIIKPMEFTTQEYLLGVQGPNAEAVFEAVDELNMIDWIEWAAPNIAFSPKPCGQIIPNDEYWSELWHLHNAGQFGGTPNDDINAPEAWEITTGDPNVVVAVIDTGADLDHPDLVNNLVPGYDFYNNDDLPEPTNSAQAHGTACAGLIAAEGNNSIGVVGVTWKCKVMPIRAYIWGGWGATPESEIATAVRWAAAHGADILSNSWEDNIPLPIVRSAFVDVTRTGGIGRNGKGCIVLAAAGNEGSIVHTPAAYPEVVAVGGTDSNDVRWNYSNYGPELDVVAPTGGWPVLPPMWTTDIVGSIGYNSDNFYDKSILDYTDSMSGTSGACPIAAGVAALILSIEPDLTGYEVCHFLTRSAKDLGEQGRDYYYGWGRVDARAALDMVLAKRCDLNNDWKVDELDLIILNAAIDNNDLFADVAPPAKRDGIVDEQDFELLMEYWQQEIPVMPEMPEPGLIAHWKLDETEGDIARDIAGDHHSTLYGEPVWLPVDGKFAGALEFDGIDDYVITDYVLDPADGQFSAFVWIQGGAPGQVIISQADGIGTGETWLGLDAQNGNLMTGLVPPPLGRFKPEPLVSQVVITDGQWHHVGFVLDGSYRFLYVDGVEVAKDTRALTQALMSSNGGLYVGTGKDLDAGSFFSGLIDDIRIYIVALSEEEIAALAQ